MIGNDIIDLDLSLRENNWKRKGYLGKIFTTTEQRLIYAASNPNIMVWLLWSMKEAAYKIFNRATKERAFAPIKLASLYVSTTNDQVWGMVHAYGQCYTTLSYIDSKKIHTIAFPNTAEKQYSTIIIEAKEGQDYKDLLLTNGYDLLKNKYGLPYVLDKTSGNPRFASVSHHGRYVALAIGREV